jgi:4'-phosphopantetheinyl transferase
MTGEWVRPPAVWVLPDDEVHVWRMALDQGAEAIARLDAVLTAGERARAAGFYRPRDQARFVAGRGLLRVILGRYLDAAPASLQFDLNEHGKPRLVGDAAEALSFNLSHSGGLGLAAVTRGRAIGVDVEQMRADVRHGRLAKRFFSPVEVAQLDCLPEEARIAAFFHCWARKEAYIKGQGVGLALGLQSFDVTVAPDKPARLLATRPDAAEAARWRLVSLQPEPGYAGALAVRGHDWRLACWSWTEEQTEKR